MCIFSSIQRVFIICIAFTFNQSELVKYLAMLVRTLIRGGKFATNLKKVTSTNLSNSYIFLSSFSNKKFFSTLSLTESSTQFSKIGKNSLSDGDTYLNQEDYYVDGKKGSFTLQLFCTYIHAEPLFGTSVAFFGALY